MDFFNQTYNALRGPTGAPQTALDTIRRLSDRLSPSTLLSDRRAAVLTLKGLSRDHKLEVGDNALPGLLEVLENDAEIDADIGKAVLETLHTLCEVSSTSPGGEKDPAMRFTDALLQTDKASQKLFALLSDNNFYIRFTALQLLGALLQTRRTIVQGYFLKAPSATAGLLAVLEDKREIIRNESLSLIESLISQSSDIQKFLAFEGIFEKLFGIIRMENGVEGGVIVHDCLSCISGLLKFNTSNQTFFRETGLASFVTALLFFPSNLPPNEPAPQEFALQFWDQPKTANARVLIEILGMLVGSKSANEAETYCFLRCLVETALASNAPTSVKIKALQALPTNLKFPLSTYIMTPYVPVPETNGEEWDRLESASGLEILIETIVHGEYSGIDDFKRKGKEGFELRSAGITVLENYLRKDDNRVTVMQSLAPPEDPSSSTRPSAFLQALCIPPSDPPNTTEIISTQYSTIILSSLLRSSSRSRQIALTIKPPTSTNASSAGGNFFVPADGSSGPSTTPPAEEGEEEDAPQTIFQQLIEHLSLCFLSRARATSSNLDARAWDRLIIAYSSLFIQWLWEEPKAVREFLENGGLGMLVEPINQTSDVDPVVQGLCAFLLGTCYEFNRDPGEITRTSIHSILSRLGVDSLIGRMSRVKDNPRFRSINPEDAVISQSGGSGSEADFEIWFDWGFVDFWKSSYYTIQKAVGLDPDTLSSSGGESTEAMMLVASLREAMRKQVTELEDLRNKLKVAEEDRQREVTSLQTQVATLTSEMTVLQQKKSDVEKEQEDLLVFLEELSTKRRRDKEKMKQAGLEVSDDEGEEEEDGDEEE